MTNIDIAQATRLRPIDEVAAELGLEHDDYEPLGRAKAKFSHAALVRLAQKPKTGKLILVTAITPTPKGEGKTTVTVGLSQAMRKRGHNAISATREPALGPVFGVKGGACGGGYSQVLPMEDINLFFTGDFPAIAAAHNLLSALLDAHIHNGNALGLDTREITWPRTVDMNDRALREIVVGLGGRTNGVAREDGFVITPASEVMAALCLARSLEELKARLGAIVVGLNASGEPVTAAQLQAHGAMATLLRDAIRPNLVQSVEGGPALVHGGPFGNIAHGCSSLVATECALALADHVVTEAGFAADLGAEKFMNIVCRRLGRGPNAIVLVATVRALQHHGGEESLEGLRRGTSNLLRHAAHLRHYGPPIVVAINRFADDTPEELDALVGICKEHGLQAVVADPWNAGGDGCLDLADAVEEASRQSDGTLQHLYADTDSPAEKLNKIATLAYGADGVEIGPDAARKLKWLKKHGLDGLPICVAKTQSSLSDDPKKLGAPTGFSIHVRDIRLSAGAGFLVALAGEMMLMPGLGKDPAAIRIDVDSEGRVSGMF